ncbi:hypothetical protein ACOMHN_002245 [Nucella lapillus]
MSLYAAQSLVLCLLLASLVTMAQAAKKKGPYGVNLRTGAKSGRLPSGMQWHSNLTSGQSRCACDRQGVLKLTFSPQRKRVVINMTFEYSKDWTFNVGDSATNNGWAGDSSTQDNDAEVHSVNNKIYLYGRDNPAGGTYGLIYSRANFVGMQPYTNVTLNIGNRQVTADNGQQFLYIRSYKLFALNNQSDSSSGGVNRDLYLGMNRVVGSSYRYGSGLCYVSVEFFSDSLP